MLVSLANLMVASFERQNLITADPVRVMEAIVVGISFLGAGTIIKHSRERTVEGLTTSASILSVAAIGIAVALNAFILAIGVTLLNLWLYRFRRENYRKMSGERAPKGRAHHSFFGPPIPLKTGEPNLFINWGVSYIARRATSKTNTNTN